MGLHPREAKVLFLDSWTAMLELGVLRNRDYAWISLEGIEE